LFINILQKHRTPQFVSPEVGRLFADIQGSSGTESFTAMAANTFTIVMHDLLPALIPKMSFIGTLADTNLAINAQVLVSINAKLMIVLIDGLKQQDGYPLSLVAKKVIFGPK